MVFLIYPNGNHVGYIYIYNNHTDDIIMKLIIIVIIIT